MKPADTPRFSRFPAAIARCLSRSPRRARAPRSALAIALTLPLAALLPGGPAQAQTEPPAALQLSGSATLASDYRFRGLSRSDRGTALQGSLTLSHESGAYASLQASTVDGWGRSGGADAVIDLTAGYSAPVGPVTLDMGVTATLFPGGGPDSSLIQPFAALRGDLGPASLRLGAAYAPRQQALRAVSAGEGGQGPARKGDNLYLWGDFDTALPGTPVTLRAHLGHSGGASGLGPSGFALTPAGAYFDWKLGADIAAGPVTLGIAYVDTDISRARAAAVTGFAPRGPGRGSGLSPAAGALLLSATLGF